MNTYEYVLDNLKQATEERYDTTVKIGTVPISGTDEFRIKATVYKKGTTTVKQSDTWVKGTWDELSTLEYADLLLKRALEYVCHIYDNNEHTKYYTADAQIEAMPNWQDVAYTHKPLYTPKGRISVRPNIAAMVKQQLEEDKLWEEHHRVR